ncbi:hypothetical protein BYT27DRAFT_7245692 [Phlegmacium glaucopus]|nr:hypothetical protein BYT27DRAFT_7245692 [Phlegmacium glaucopus]
MDASTLALCHSLLNEVGATPSEGFFAVYNTLLCYYSSQETMVVGTAVTQRNTAQLSNIIEPLTTFLPIKTTIDSNQTFQEYLTGLKTDLSKGAENSDVIYEDINPEIADHRDAQGSSLTHTLLSLMPFPGLQDIRIYTNPSDDEPMPVTAFKLETDNLLAVSNTT